MNRSDADEEDGSMAASPETNHSSESDDVIREANHRDESDDDDHHDDEPHTLSPGNPEHPESPENPETASSSEPGLASEDDSPSVEPLRVSTRSSRAGDGGHGDEEGASPSIVDALSPRSHVMSSSRSNADAKSTFVDEEEPDSPRPANRQSAAFSAWASPESGSSYTIGPFVLLLIEEFCRQYELTDTAAMLQRELRDLDVQFPDSNLWFEMYGHCRSILGNRKHSNTQASSTTIEKLVEFCVNPVARRAVFSLDMASAHSPVNFSASPKRGTPAGTSAFSLLVAYNQIRSPIVRPSQRPSSHVVDAKTTRESHQDAPDDNHADGHVLHQSSASTVTPAASPVAKSPLLRKGSNSIKKKKKRKARQQRSSSVISVLSHGSPQRDHGYGSQQAPVQLVPGTFGEPVLVDTHKTDLKRDLTTTRLLEKELRDVRIEKISTEPKITIQKRLGFRTPTAAEELERQKLQDPYASELVMEKYGFSKRQDCALCQFPFLMYNLPHKVSFKCVMDVYDHWNYVPPDRETAPKFKPPLCYDAVHVCRMCAQIVFEHTKQPESHLLERAPRPLSRKHKKAKSLANLHQEKPDEELSFCSDPYALPPLLGDDVIEQPEALTRYFNAHRQRVGGLRGDDAHDGDLRGSVSEFPAKAMIYSQQIESSRFMSSKEWDIINPDKSSTRHILEATLRR